jgi:hypothetical protein
LCSRLTIHRTAIGKAECGCYDKQENQTEARGRFGLAAFTVMVANESKPAVEPNNSKAYLV